MLRLAVFQLFLISSAFPPFLLQQQHGKCTSFRLLPCFLDGTRADPSNKGEVEQLLHDRSVQFSAEATESTNPLPSFKSVWELFRKELPDGGDCLPSADDALKNLTKVMRAAYAREIDFDTDAFEAVKALLAAYTLLGGDRNSIILSIGDTHKYALGITRQKAPAGNLVQNSTYLDKEKKQRWFHTSTGMNAKSVADHAACVFRKDEKGKWSVTDIFSIVELKTNATTCESFDFDDIDGEMLPPDLSDRHAALGQVVLYNLGQPNPADHHSCKEKTS